MDPRIAGHQPSEAAKRRAERAGVELDRLRSDDPQQYAMLCAEAVVQAPAVLLSTVAGEVMEHLPNRMWFELPGQRQGLSVLLSFPPLSGEELGQLDDVLAKLAAREDFAGHFAYYRVVNDLKGERREFGVALAPRAWEGEVDVMVGPFAASEEAQAWVEARLAGRGALASDVVEYGGHWFVDVFEVRTLD